MTGLDWLGACACFAAVVGLLTWAFAALADARPRPPEARAESHKPRSPMQIYLDGGGDLSNPRVVALLGEAERGWNRNRHDADDA